MSETIPTEKQWTPALLISTGQLGAFRVDVSNEVLDLIRAFVGASSETATALESLAETAIALAAEHFKPEGDPDAK